MLSILISRPTNQKKKSSLEKDVIKAKDLAHNMQFKFGPSENKERFVVNLLDKVSKVTKSTSGK